MKKEITRIIDLKGATIEIKMTYYNRLETFGNHLETKEILKSTESKFYINGEFKAKSSEEMIYPVDSEKGRFGDILLKATTVDSIIKLIKEMHIELSREFGIKTLDEIKLENKIADANRIMAEVETRQTEILSDADEKIWMINYNNTSNEGGEGYISARVTLEDIEAAKIILESKGC